MSDEELQVILLELTVRHTWNMPDEEGAELQGLQNMIANEFIGKTQTDHKTFIRIRSQYFSE